jgi:hypothetical protein
MTDRTAASGSLVFVLVALACGGQSKGAFHDSPSTGGNGGNGGSGGNGGASTAGGAGGGSSGSGARAGSGATSGDGGHTSAGAAGSPSAGTAGSPSAGGAENPSAGAAGTSSDAGAASAGMAGASGAAPDGPLNGHWGMFWFEDPVVVAIQQQGEALSGSGCCAGLPGSPQALPCCGPLEGTTTDARASFAFPTQGDAFVYSTNVYVSDNYERMGGTFSADDNGSFAVAWVRLPGGMTNLGAPPTALREALTAREGRFELMLSSASVGRFEPLTPIELQLSGLGLLRGAFGPFYWGDMLWYAASETLAIGPVLPTDPSFATSIELRFEDGTLKSVLATYPNEPPYSFIVTGTTD